MERLSDERHRAICYVMNTAGEATKEQFLDDHAPIGEFLWNDIQEYVEINESGKVVLTDKGLVYTTRYAR